MGDHRPLASILLPVFNERSSFLRHAVNSILDQTFCDYELIVLDDGSDDLQTVHELEKLAKKDKRIRFHRHNNMGLIKTLNKGISLARGELIFRQDSDDWSEPDRFQRQVDFLDKNPSLGLVGSNCMMRQEDGTPLWASDLPLEPHDVLACFPRMNPFAHGSVCFRKSCVVAVGNYRDFCKHAEDYDLFWRLCERFGGGNLSEVLYHYRRTGSSIMATHATQWIKTGVLIRALAKTRSSGDPENMGLALALAENYLKRLDLESLARSDTAKQNMLAGHYKKAWALYLRNLKSHPLDFRGFISILRFLVFLFTPTLVLRWIRGGLKTRTWRRAKQNENR
jgi:glycosyltransferase involved in cell wall biosynthesis